MMTQRPGSSGCQAGSWVQRIVHDAQCLHREPAAVVLFRRQRHALEVEAAVGVQVYDSGRVQRDVVEAGVDPQAARATCHLTKI